MFILFFYRKRNWIITWECKDRQEECNWDTGFKAGCFEKSLSDLVLFLLVTLSSCFRFLLLQYMWLQDSRTNPLLRHVRTGDSSLQSPTLTHTPAPDSTFHLHQHVGMCGGAQVCCDLVCSLLAVCRWHELCLYVGFPAGCGLWLPCWGWHPLMSVSSPFS